MKRDPAISRRGAAADQEPISVESDDARMLAAARTDPDAFGTFYDRHFDAVLSYCMRRTGCAQTAADLTAETFAAAYARRATFRDTGAPARAWLYGIARRQMGSYNRRRRVSDRYRQRFGLGALEVAPDELRRIEAMIDFAPLRVALAEAVASLPQAQADALQLRIVDELAYKEIAERLGCSEGAARVRVSRGLARLATLLEASS